ncbi:MAG: uncharacterized protein KVP18_003277 [Porospora cf. gigantea A]|uniref:uncharacterized protein n=1 Tax=Porospora cf. gigantea A TaxID=2853593 RepID=UPI00355A13FE|nr:MAG: hypothetical protein KVP18_003277 [Porospora cf. gigantea A]
MAISETYTAEPSESDTTKTKTRPVIWDTPIAIPERPTLVYDTPIAISETYTAAPSDSDSTKTKTRPVVWDTPIAIPERPTLVYDTPIAIPERPTLVYDTPMAISETYTAEPSDSDTTKMVTRPMVWDTPIAISEIYTAEPSDSDTTKTKTRPVIWDTPIAIPERPTLVYDTPIAISETYTAEPSDSDTTKRPTFVWDTPITIPETATPVWDTPITIPETATPVWDTPMTIPERPTPVWDTPITIPETPMPVWDTPITIPETPTPVWDTPITIPETPTPVWDTPITIPETPTPVWDTPITISETYTASTGHQTSTGGANVSVTSMAAQITRIGETTTISSQCVKPLTALDGEQLLVLDANGVMSCMTYCHERRNCTHFEFNIESFDCRLLRDPHTAWHDSTVISGRGCTAPAVYRTVAAIVGAAAVLGGVAGGAMWIFKSRREPTQSFRVTKAPTYKVQNSLLPGSTPVAPAEYSTEFAAGSAPGTGNARGESPSLQRSSVLRADV